MNKDDLLRASEIIDNKYLLKHSTNETSLTFKILNYEFLNFIEVWIHLVLYVMDVYPKEAFVPFSQFNLNFLYYIKDNEVNEYINEFLSSIEPFVFQNLVTKVYLMIINDENNEIKDIFFLDINFTEYLNFSINLHQNLEMCFKSILSDFYYKTINKKKENKNDDNTSFSLCIELNDNQIIKGKKLYNELYQNIINKFVHDLISKDFLKIVTNKKIYSKIENSNISISINHYSKNQIIEI
jgi:hypothetical protein